MGEPSARSTSWMAVCPTRLTNWAGLAGSSQASSWVGAAEMGLSGSNVQKAGRAVAAQVEFECKIEAKLKAVYRISLSSA